MKKYALSLGIAGLLSFCPPSQGVYRWEYKILIDEDGMKLLNSEASASTVKDLNNIERPSKEEMKDQRAAEEKRKVTVSGVITEAGKEADGDYHLVFQDEEGNSLIAEIPDPSQDDLNDYTELKNKYSEARQFVQQHIEAHPGEIKPLPHTVKVTITGIVFFDKIAHGSGHAGNGVEIHPILNISAAD